MYANTSDDQHPTTYGSLPPFCLRSEDTISRDGLHDVQAVSPTFIPDGGVFVRRTVVRVSSDTSGTSITVTSKETEAFQEKVLLHVDIPGLEQQVQMGRMKNILDNYATCVRKDALVFKLILWRYPHVAGATIHVFEPYILVTSTKGSPVLNDYSIRYCVYVNEGTGLPSLRFSTARERALLLI